MDARENPRMAASGESVKPKSAKRFSDSIML
jgi:hypothetical protein